MKTFKRVLCVMLSVLMAFSCMSFVGAAADETKQFSYTLKYKSERPDSFNADYMLDELDKVLAEADIYEVVDLEVTELVIDLRSVNSLCKTLDDLKTDALVQVGKHLLGDLSDLSFKTWPTGMQRGSKDATITKELIEFLNANRSIISGVCDATLDLGVLKNYVDIKELLGEDGVSGIIKEVLINIVYDGEAVDANYAKYKDDIDSFIYGDLIGKFANDYLPGFKMDQNSKVADLVCLVAGLVIDEYVIPTIKELNIDLASEDSEDLKALAPYVNLKGSTYDFSAVTVKNNGDFLGQVNDIVGAIFKQIIPGCEWQSGSWDKINENIEGAFKYLGTQSGLIADAQSMTFDQIVMEVISIITRNVDLGVYDDGVGECDTLDEVVAVLLMNVAKKQDLAVTYKGDESYLVVAGDILAWFMYSKFDIKDLDGNAYREGGNKDVFEVANYVLNYFLFEKGAATVLGLDTTSKSDFFTKLDLLLDYFAQDKSKGIAFNSKNFIMGTDSQKGLLDAILDLDIEAVIGMTAVKAINAAGNVSAVEFIYKSIQYALNNWAGSSNKLLPDYQDKAFTNALSNTNIATLVKNLLAVLNSRKDAFVPLAFFSATVAMDDTETVHTVTQATVADFEATGNKATPVATVKIGDTVLKQGVDFDVLSENIELGQATAKVKGAGLYNGEFEVPFNIVLGKVGKVNVTYQSTKSLKFAWDAVPYADKYNVYLLKSGEFSFIKSVTDPAVSISGLKPGTKYTFKIEAENATYGKTEGAEVKTVTKPNGVKGASITWTATDSTVTLTWTKASGAISYKVDQYIDGAWKEVTAVAGNTATIKGLKGYTSYKFRVRSYTRDHNKAIVCGAASAAVTAKTSLESTGLKAASSTSSSLKLSWSKANNATGYQLQQYINKNWKTVKNTTGSSYTVSGLKANTKYYFRVRAYVKTSSGYVYGPFTKLTTYTNLAKTASAKVKKTTATAATLSWSKVSGAAGYQVWMYSGGKWVRKTNTTSTSATISGLKSGTKYYFRVRAYRKSGSSYIYGDYTSNITALTLPAAVTGIKAASRTKSAIKLTWTKCTGATGYQVYRYSGGKWVKVATTTSTSYTNSGLKKNTQYKYKIRAYQKVGSTYKYGAYSSTFSARTRLF